MVQKLTGPDALSISELSTDTEVPRSTLSRWLTHSGHKASIGFSNNLYKNLDNNMTAKRPSNLKPEEKLKIVNEANSLSNEQLGAFLRSKGIHETHLEQWRMQILGGLGKTEKNPKTNATDTKRIKRIRELEKELKRKDKALAETAALLVLKKKVQEIWGDEDDNTVTTNGKRS
jgi:transposase-like protein